MVKITVHSLADLKNTSDDVIPTYLNSLGFVQSHTLSDTRLAIGYSAFAICAACFYWDYTLGFTATKSYTAVAVALYTLLNGLLTYWIWAVEAGTLYVGTHKTSGDKIAIATKTEKHIPIYNVTVTVYPKASPNSLQVVKVKKPFTHWFDKAGNFIQEPFWSMLASNVPVIGKADPTRVAEKERKSEDANVSMEDKWANLLAESAAATGAEEITPSKGAKKRSKKA